MSRLGVLGASGHGRAVADIASSQFEEIVFFDDAWPGKLSCGVWAVTGDTARMVSNNGYLSSALVAIGDNSVRVAKARYLQGVGLDLVRLIHDRAVVSRRVEIDEGSVILGGAVVNFGAQLGFATIVNSGAIVEHDCVLSEGVHVSPGAVLSGGVEVGARTWIGAGAAIKQGIVIGSDVIVGAGAVVIRDVPDGATVVGVPARSIG